MNLKGRAGKAAEWWPLSHQAALTLTWVCVGMGPGGDSGMGGPPGAPRSPQSDLPFPSSEIRGPSHSTGAQSRPRAAAHSAGAPARSRGSRGACLLHLPLGKLGLGPGWAGEGCRPFRPRGGNGAGDPQGPQPRSRLHLRLWAADSVLEPSHFPHPRAPVSSRAQILLREGSGFSPPRDTGWETCRVAGELSDPVGWAAEAWRPARGRPR